MLRAWWVVLGVWSRQPGCIIHAWPVLETEPAVRSDQVDEQTKLILVETPSPIHSVLPRLDSAMWLG
jgi:hypothetical protein